MQRRYATRLCKSVIENGQVRASRLVMVAMVAMRTIASWCSGLAS